MASPPAADSSAPIIQPLPTAPVIANAYAAIPAANNSEPRMSKVARDLPLPDGSAGKWTQANPNANKPNGTLIRKIDDQPGPASSNPPSEGPSAVPMADIVPSRPITLPVFSLATASLA
ncbi:hypothetical protein G6F59_017757 [Rhizopus arrhizus]|nr:hypothetical protein G6F59_017757 [Rhizopus arrhizus]